MPSNQEKRLALLVTRNFPPLLGGMEKVNQQMLIALQQGWRIALCGPAGCAEFAPEMTEVRQSRVKPLPAFLIAAFWRAMYMAIRKKPEWVIAGSGLTAPIAWIAARSTGAKVAVYLHGLDIVAPSRAYQWIWLPFIRRCDALLVNSSNTARLAESKGVPRNRVHLLHPGTELPELNSTASNEFRKHFGLAQKPLLLSVGRLTQRKGLAEFVTQALPIIVSRVPDTLLIVVGDEAVDALSTRAGSERARILAAAREAGVGDKVLFLGRCNDLTLSQAYQASDLHIFPVLELAGDVEGFGMVALESAAHGLSSVAFAVGGVPDALHDGCTGTLIEPGDYAAMAAEVIRRLGHTRDQTGVSDCRKFAAGKTWPIFGDRLRELLGVSNG